MPRLIIKATGRMEMMPLRHHVEAPLGIASCYQSSVSASLGPIYSKLKSASWPFARRARSRFCVPSRNSHTLPYTYSVMTPTRSGATEYNLRDIPKMSERRIQPRRVIACRLSFFLNQNDTVNCILVLMIDLRNSYG